MTTVLRTPAEVREELVRALRIDLVGPAARHPPDAAYEREQLPMSPWRWYLTGFLVPTDAPDEQRSDEASQEEMDLAGDADIDGDDDRTPEQQAARRVTFPSSIGLSVLVSKECEALEAMVSWGDYTPEESAQEPTSAQGDASGATPPVPRDRAWTRTPCAASLRLPIPSVGDKSRPVLVRRAFQLANKAVAEAARRRSALQSGKLPAEMPAPAWRRFQLAFILLNVAGIADSSDTDRELVDLLFFPTGGGKTETYLGLAAFTLLLRRLRNPTIASAGMTVLMRYTLRLLTLDQLDRAATLVCAVVDTGGLEADAYRGGQVSQELEEVTHVAQPVGEPELPPSAGGLCEDHMRILGDVNGDPRDSRLALGGGARQNGFAQCPPIDDRHPGRLPPSPQFALAVH